MNETILDVLKEYEDIENRSNILDPGHYDKMPITKFEKRLRRFLK